MENYGDSNGRVRVAVVDDDADTRLCFRDILHSENKFHFAGGFASAREALTEIPCLQPDLVLMDIKLPDMDGIECVKQIKRSMPHLRVVIVSGNRDRSSVERSIAAGAVTFLIKPVDPDQLLAALQFAAGPIKEPIRKAPGKFQRSSPATLTQREQVVLSKLAEGLLYKEISDALGISYAAVHKCQHRIFRKLRVGNRSEAALAWLQNRKS
jgi:DNA-binding NarL/FixJ family response regulator